MRKCASLNSSSMLLISVINRRADNAMQVLCLADQKNSYSFQDKMRRHKSKRGWYHAAVTAGNWNHNWSSRWSFNPSPHCNCLILIGEILTCTVLLVPALITPQHVSCHKSHIPRFINQIKGYTCGAMTMAKAIYSQSHIFEEGRSWWPIWLGNGFIATHRTPLMER
jgi:hypothetical protein